MEGKHLQADVDRVGLAMTCSQISLPFTLQIYCLVGNLLLHQSCLQSGLVSRAERQVWGAGPVLCQVLWSDPSQLHPGILCCSSCLQMVVSVECKSKSYILFPQTILCITQAVPWPDEVVNMMSVFCPGDDNNSRLIRRTVVRWGKYFLMSSLHFVQVHCSDNHWGVETNIQQGQEKVPQLWAPGWGRSDDREWAEGSWEGPDYDWLPLLLGPCHLG